MSKSLATHEAVDILIKQAMQKEEKVIDTMETRIKEHVQNSYQVY